MGFGRAGALGRAAVGNRSDVAIVLGAGNFTFQCSGLFGPWTTRFGGEGKRQKFLTRQAFAAGLRASHVRVGAKEAAVALLGVFAEAAGIRVNFLGKESIFIKHGDFLRVGDGWERA